MKIPLIVGLGLGIGLLVLHGGCFDPNLAASKFTCRQSNECPSGFSCDPADKICKQASSTVDGRRPGQDGRLSVETSTDRPPSDDRRTADGRAPDRARDTGKADLSPDGAQTKQVPCDPNNNNPPHSTDIVVNVTIVYDPVTKTWSAPAKCAWSCDANYCLEGNSCVTSKSVQCNTNNGNPPNSTDVIAPVIVTCQAGGTFSPPAPCAWSCNAGYAANKTGTACVHPIYLVTAGAAPYGQAGGNRATMDSRCVSAVNSIYAGLNTTNTAAFISITASDEIADLPVTHGVPTNRPILGPTAIRIADDWMDLLDGSIKVTLAAASVLTFNFWYSGSTPSGTVAANTCTSWTATSGNFGTYGRADLTNSGWITAGDSGWCGGTYYYLCLTWAP